MTETPTKREQQREERRRQILDSALVVFSQGGFHATNVSDVAAHAGVSQGTIYWYFDSKEDLFTGALLSFFEKFGQETAAAIDECQKASEKLYALAASMEAFAREAAGMFMMFLSYWASSREPEGPGQLWVDLLVEYKDLLAGIVEEGIQSGEFRGIDAEALAWALMAAYDGLAAYLMLMPDIDIKRVNKAFVEALLNGLTT
jgi:AcrR family transcriptional regulator